MAGSINFFSEEISFTLKNKIKVRNWISETILQESRHLRELNIIFCSDDYLLNINRQYLNHDTFTDIITFDTGIGNDLIGDIFISIERVRENASSLNIPEVDELHRVIIHGVLHLIGYGDKKPSQKMEMTAKEDIYLSVRKF